MAGVLGIYGLIVAVILSGSSESTRITNNGGTATIVTMLTLLINR